MQIPERLLTMFSAEVEERDGEAVVVLPERELRVGELQVGDSYRVALLPTPGDASGSGATGTSSGSTAGSGGSGSGSGGEEPPVSEGERHEVEIEDTGEQGDGIARVGPGYIVFVPGTDVGDRVTVEITKARDNFAFAEVVEEEPVGD